MRVRIDTIVSGLVPSRHNLIELLQSYLLYLLLLRKVSPVGLLLLQCLRIASLHTVVDNRLLSLLISELVRETRN